MAERLILNQIVSDRNRVGLRYCNRSQDTGQNKMENGLGGMGSDVAEWYEAVDATRFESSPSSSVGSNDIVYFR